MIRWHLDPVAHGPLVRARILADDGDGTKREAVGSAIVTRAQLDDLTARLAEGCTCYDGNPANYEGAHADCVEHGAIRAYNEVQAELTAAQRERDTWHRAASDIAAELTREAARTTRMRATLERVRALAERWVSRTPDVGDGLCRCPRRGSTMHAEPTSPCARCGKPVPAGQATHADCQPIRCLFCTQCGRRLSGDERAAGARVCLVSCAPLAEGLVAS